MTLVLSALVVGVPSYLDSALNSAIRTGLADFPVVDTFDVSHGDDSDVQRQRGMEVIDAALVSAGNPPVVVESGNSPSGGLRWILAPDLRVVTMSNLPALATIGARVSDALGSAQSVAPNGVAHSSDLSARADQLQRSLDPMVGIQALPLSLVAIVGLIAIVEFGRLLVVARSRESLLLRARGASSARIAAQTAAEAATASVMGVIGGILIVGWLLDFLGPPDALLTLTPILLVLIATPLIFGGLAWRAAALIFRRDSAHGSSRAQRVTAGLGSVAVTVAGLLTTVRFFQMGSPVLVSAETVTVDPIATLAPALTLLAIVTVGLAAFRLVVGAARSPMARSRNVEGALALSQVARRPRMFAPIVVLTGLAVGGLFLAASYQPTWSAVAYSTANLHNGADLVVSGAGDADSIVDRIRTLHDVTAAAPVLLGSARLDGGGTYDAVAIPWSTIGDAATDADGAVRLPDLASTLEVRLPAVPIPRASESLTASLAWTGAAPELTAQLVDAEGRVATARFTASSAPNSRPGVLALSAPLPAPETSEGWMLASLDVYLSISSVEQAAAPAVSGEVASVGAVSPSGNTPLELGEHWTLVSGASQFTASGSVGYAGNLHAGVSLRLVPQDGAPTPVAMSTELAQRLGVGVGDPVTLETGVTEGPLRATVAAVVPVLPGSRTDLSLLFDMASAQVQSLRNGGSAATPDRVWVRAGDPTRAAEEIRSALPGSQVTGASLDPVLRAQGTVATALWLGAMGSSLLAVSALAAVVASIWRLRADEAALLRALGLPAQRLARSRLLEMVIVYVGGATVGTIAGLAVVLLMVRGLTRAAVIEPYVALPQTLRFDVQSLTVAISVFAIATACIGLVYGRQLRRTRRLGLVEGSRA